MIYRWRLSAMARGIHLEEIAQRVEKDLPYISRLSRGLVKPPEPLKAKIAEAVGLPVERAWRRVNG